MSLHVIDNIQDWLHLQVHAAESTVYEFRADVIRTLSAADSSSGLIVNYDMDVLGQKQPYGHHSPVGAYHLATDTVLVLDVWKHTEECWATAADLFKAMNTVDKESGLTRGYVIANVWWEFRI